MMNKKGFMEGKNYLSIVLGLILLAVGLIPLLQTWGIVSWGLPGFIANVIAMIAVFVVAGGGFWLLIDSIYENEGLKWLTAIVALVILVIGVIQILHNFAIIGFSIPFLTMTVYNYIFTVEGLGLIIAGFAMD